VADGRTNRYGSRAAASPVPGSVRANSILGASPPVTLVGFLDCVSPHRTIHRAIRCQPVPVGGPRCLAQPLLGTVAWMADRAGGSGRRLGGRGSGGGRRCRVGGSGGESSQHAAIRSSNSARTSSGSPHTTSTNASSSSTRPAAAIVFDMPHSPTQNANQAGHSHPDRRRVVAPGRGAGSWRRVVAPGRGAGQASICLCPESAAAMAILRGLACSAIGIRSVSTPDS
jgi:hypothetical protein